MASSLPLFASIRRQWAYPGLFAGVSALAYSQVAAPVAAESAAEAALNPKEFIPLKVLEKKQLTKDTFQYRLELPAGKVSGLNVASCLVTRAMIPDAPGEAPKAVIRPYTPTSSKEVKGYMDLVVKVYPTGKMSKHIGTLEVGDSIDVKGPIPKLAYKPNMKKHIGMIAGGSGITPMIQVIDEILSDPNDKTQISLLFANHTEADIILKDRLDRLAANYPGRFKVWYVISQGKFSGSLQPGVVKSVGRINKETIRSFIPGPKDDVLVFVCGPPGMMNAISGPKAPDYTQGELKGALAELGFNSSQVFKF